MTNLEEVNDTVLHFIRFNQGSSFVELESELIGKNLVESSTASIDISYKFKNLIIWTTSNKLLVESVDSLLKEEKILVKPCSVLIYGIDGKVLMLPKAKSIRDYKDPHWIPVEISTNSKKVPEPTSEEYKKEKERFRANDWISSVNHSKSSRNYM